jgi:hypothetical protein
MKVGMKSPRSPVQSELSSWTLTGYGGAPARDNETSASINRDSLATAAQCSPVDRARPAPPRDVRCLVR